MTHGWLNKYYLHIIDTILPSYLVEVTLVKWYMDYMGHTTRVTSGVGTVGVGAHSKENKI